VNCSSGLGRTVHKKIVEQINKLSVFRIEPLDTRAAIEVAAMTRATLDGPSKNKRGAVTAPWTKIKYDRQIVAIAKVARATTIYSDDQDIRGIAEAAAEHIRVIGLADLPLPEETRQGELPFETQGRPQDED
jgi:hypothetical protein